MGWDEKIIALSGQRLAILQPFRREQIHAFLVSFWASRPTRAS
jgi:hypothetical protein